MIVLHHVGKTGKYAGWQGTLSDVLIRHSKGSTETERNIARSLRSKLTYVKATSDTEFFGILNAHGWARNQVPGGGAEFNRVKENRELLNKILAKK